MINRTLDPKGSWVRLMKVSKMILDGQEAQVCDGRIIEISCVARIKKHMLLSNSGHVYSLDSSREQFYILVDETFPFQLA